MLRDGTSALSHLGRSRLRGGHDEQLRIGDELGYRQGNVASTWRQVQQEHVQVAPEDVREELLEGAVEHRPAPDYGRVALHELANGDVLDAVGDGGKQHFVVNHCGARRGTQQAGHGVTINIGVHDAHLEALLDQGRGKVHRNGRLAHATLAGGHRKDSGGGFRLGKGDLRLGLAAAQLLLEFFTLLVAHRRHGDADVADTVELCDGRAGIGLDGALHWAAGDGEIKLDIHVRTVNSHGFHHAELRDGAADFWVINAGKRVANGRFSNSASHNAH